MIVTPSDEARAVWPTERDVPSEPVPALQGTVTADVAVIGGGFTGVSTAWHLARRFPDRGIVLLEARELGSGASGRNGGQVLNWINGVEPVSPTETRRIYDATMQGIALAEHLARTYAPPDTFRRAGCVEMLTDAARAEAAHARVDALAALGIPAEFVSGAALRVTGAHGAVVDPMAGRLNGWALLQGMRAALRAQGVALYERSPVTRIAEGATMRLPTPAGEVRAHAVVLATNAYTPRLGYFRRGILPLHSHVLATAPLDPARWEAIGWGTWDGFSDDADRIAYACRTPTGRLLLGGGDNAAYSYRFGGNPEYPFAPSHPAWEAMARTMRRYFPALGDVPITHRWTGPLAVTLDRQCAMGVRGRHRNVYYALGYSGHGIALGLLAGKVLTDLYEGNHEAWRDLPFYQKRLLPMPPEPLRWIGYQLYTRWTGRAPRRRG